MKTWPCPRCDGERSINPLGIVSVPCWQCDGTGLIDAAKFCAHGTAKPDVMADWVGSCVPCLKARVRYAKTTVATLSNLAHALAERLDALMVDVHFGETP